jgi:L-aminopeptidase/D-esterase-like protein
MIVIATDAPLDARSLKRLAARALLGLARTGSSASNGSGDYAIAFSTAPQVRIHANDNAPNNQIDPEPRSVDQRRHVAAVSGRDRSYGRSSLQLDV